MAIKAEERGESRKRSEGQDSVGALKERPDPKGLKKRVWDFVLMTVASAMYAASVALFLDPNSLAPGGVTGIAIILNRLTSVETGTLIMLINVPILLLGVWKFGLRFIASTLYCTFLISAFTNLMEPIGALTTDPLLAAVAGSTLMAFAMGWTFKAGATTGGTDIIIKLIRLKMPYLKTGSIFLATDAAIVVCSAVVLGDIEKAMYAGITVVLISMILDLVLYGRDEAKLVYIISDHSEIITDRFLKELDLGVTKIRGKGAYSGKEKDVIFCAMKKPLAPRAEEIVKQEDPEAFMIISSATEIYGEGYKSYFGERL